MATCIGPESFVISKSHHFMAAAKGPNLKAPVATIGDVFICATTGLTISKSMGPPKNTVLYPLLPK